MKFTLVFVPDQPYTRKSALSNDWLGEDKSTASSLIESSSPGSEGELDTEEAATALPVPGSHFRPSLLQPILHRKRFKQELEKLGWQADLLLDKNPNKVPTEPSTEEDMALLPYQRRARSNSPHREELDLTKKVPIDFFPSQGPVKAMKPVCRQAAPIDLLDEEMERLKLEYERLLDATVNLPPQRSLSRRTKITFM